MLALGACSVPGPDARDEDMNKLSRKFLTLDAGYAVSYLEGGEANGRLVVFVHGMSGDLVPFANVAFMKAHLTGARLEVDEMPGQNHFLPWNAKAQVNAAIAKAAAAVSP